MKKSVFFDGCRPLGCTTLWACLFVCTICGQLFAVDDEYSKADYRAGTIGVPDGMARNFILSSSRDASNPAFRNLPDSIILSEGDFYHCEISVRYIFPDSVKIDLVDGHNIDDALIDFGGGKASLHLSADHTMVDSTYRYILSARHGRIRTFDTVVVAVVNRPLEVISIIPDVSAEILASEKPIRIKFNEPIDGRSLKNGVRITDVRGGEFNHHFIREENTLVINTGNNRWPSRDTINIYLTSGLLDLAGYPVEHPRRLTFTTGPLVYPGDANDDGIVDKSDIVPIVRYWGYTGPSRAASQPLAWIAQAANSWEEFMAGFADVNGDGVVNGDDACGAVANLGKRSGDFNAGRINSTETPEKMLAGADQTVLKDLFLSVINCPEGDGQQSIIDILKSLLFDDRAYLPDEYILYQNYPNPFNPETIIEYFLPEPAQLRIGVYNIIGQKVFDLYDGFASEGFGSVIWYGIDNFSKPVASGIYFYRLETESLALTKRMILIR